MTEPSLVANEELCNRLPLPLAQLYRRAYMAKSDLERHQVAYCLWEASLKVLTSVVIFEYAKTPRQDEEHAALLQKLIRPDVSHWCQILRKLLPVTAHDDALLHRTQVLFSSAIQDELPYNAELAIALQGQPTGHPDKTTLFDLFDALVAYRESVFGSAPFADRPSVDYQRIGRALLAATGEWLLRIDVLAGQQLTYVSDVTAQQAGRWLIQRYSLVGDLARRLRPLEVAGSTQNLPRAGRVYLDAAVQATNMSDSASLAQMQSLHPLILFDVGLDHRAIAR
ncbi:MAG: hypothetical protein ACO1RT_05620 [Planctomycetaceae bacterium]